MVINPFLLQLYNRVYTRKVKYKSRRFIKKKTESINRSYKQILIVLIYTAIRPRQVLINLYN